MLKPKNTIAAVEADFVALQKRRTAIDARRISSAAAAQAATSARRALLVDSDEPDPKALAAADRACRETADGEGAAVDALAEIDNRIAAVEGRLAGLREVADRERRAAAIEAAAKAADVAIERIRRIAGELDSARRDLAAALLPEAVACYAPPSNTADWGPRYLTTQVGYDFSRSDALHDALNVEQVAARLAGHLISGALKGLGVARLEDVVVLGVDGRSTPILGPVSGEAAASLLTDPMRAVAAGMRRGDADQVRVDLARRRRADRWHTDADGVSTDDTGKLVDGRGFYVDQADAPAILGATPRAPEPVRQAIALGVERIRPAALAPVKVEKGAGYLGKHYPEGTVIYPPGAEIPDDEAAA